MNRIRKGDTVEVITGDDRGLRGEVLRVIRITQRVVISGVNIVTKHQSAQRAGRGVTGDRIRLSVWRVHLFHFDVNLR